MVNLYDLFGTLKRTNNITEAPARRLRLILLAGAGISCHAFAGILTSGHGHGKSGHDNAYHRHKFYKDVERRTRRVLEGVAHSVAYDRRLAARRAFTAAIPPPNHPLSIAPPTPSIRHEHGKGETCRHAADKETEHACHAKDDADDNGYCYCKERGKYHFAK